MIYGQGKINGNASKENWWKDPKVMNIAFRPRLFFISGCKNVTLQGVTFCNSPSWTLHPYFSNDLKFIGVTVQNPSDSPNTDGLDPESCKNVEILGVRFSLGDDCIAVKSGNVYLGFADRFTGTMIITGEISDVMSAMTEVVDYFRDTLGYVVCKITKR